MKKCDRHLLKGVGELIRVQTNMDKRVMNLRQVSTEFKAVFSSGNYWNPERGYVETEKLGTTLDSLTRLVGEVEFRHCKGVISLRKTLGFQLQKDYIDFILTFRD